MSYYSIIGQKTELLTELLTDEFSYYGYTVREEYDELIAESPISTPVLTVGMHSLTADTHEFNQLIGQDIQTGSTAYGRAVLVTYRVTVHSSAEHAYTVCRSAASIIAEACIGVFDVVHVTSGLSKYDRQSRCVTMPIDVTVRYIVM